MEGENGNFSQNRVLRPVLKVEEVLSLLTLNIQGPFGLNNCSLSSENWLSTYRSNEVAIVDIHKKTAFRRSTAADTAAIHPNGNMLVVRAGQLLQMFDLTSRNRLKHAELNDNNVALWKWINNETLAIVTSSAVLHWNVSDSGNPKVMMLRNEKLASGSAINYHVSENQEWLILVTVSVTNGRVVGCCQLFSVKLGCCQILNADVAIFTTLTLPSNTNPSNLLAFATRTESGGRLSIALLGKPTEGEKPFSRKTEDLNLPSGDLDDFPMALEAENKLGVLCIVWKSGFVGIHDIESGRSLYATQCTTPGIFSTVSCLSGGFMALNKLGQLLYLSINSDELLSHLESNFEVQVAISFVLRSGTAGTNVRFYNWFERLMQNGRYRDAAWLAARAPQNCLRQRHIAERLRQVTGPGSSVPLLVYFGEILDHGRMLTWEAEELCLLVLNQNRVDLVEKWLREDKLECSESLGDLLLPYHHVLALSVFIRAEAMAKVVMCFAKIGQFPKLFEYAERMSYTPDFLKLITMLLTNEPQNAIHLTIMAIELSKLGAELNNVVDMFLEKGLVDESIILLSKAVEMGRSDAGVCETRLLSLHLQQAPHLADALLGSRTLSHFDRLRVAQLCEQHELWHRALELYTEVSDWQRVLAHASCIPLDHLLTFFFSIDATLIVPCLKSMLAANRSENITIAVKVASSCIFRVSCLSIVQLFEDFNEENGLFQILNQLGEIQDEALQVKYVVTAIRLGKINELEMYCRTTNFINANQVRCQLMENKLLNTTPLMILCDRYNFVKDLIEYLQRCRLCEQITYFITHINSSRLLAVLETLLTNQAEDNVVGQVVLLAVENDAPQLISLLERCGRLPLAAPWLKTLLDGSTESVAVHTALAKIAVLQNNSPERLLQENNFYDFHAMGKFCELRNPELAVLAYARGRHDDDLLRICEEAGLTKVAARYLLHRSDSHLWTKALTLESDFKFLVAESIKQLVTLEIFNSEQISHAVKALLAANLQSEFFKLLETLVFDCPEFEKNRNLQNLLILSAIKINKAKVQDLILTLHDYDATDVAAIAVNNGLFEEAFTIYQRSGANGCAMEILLNHLKNWDRATAFAYRCDSTDVWALLGKECLTAGRVEQAVDALVRAGDASCYPAVVKITSETGQWSLLARYLQSARKSVKEPSIDAEMIYVYARTGQMEELEKILGAPHNANVLEVAERCFGESLLEAARILFKCVNNQSRLAETLALLGYLSDAVTSARKAGNLQCWCTLCDIALKRGDIEVAKISAKNLALNPDEITALVNTFESQGLVKEIITVLEDLLDSDQTSGPVYTELALLYIRYEPSKCKAYLAAWWEKLCVARVLRALQESHLWAELSLLLQLNGDFSEAVTTTMSHPTEAWNHSRFKELLSKVMNTLLVEPLIKFYLDYKPLLLDDILLSLGSRIDGAHVVNALSNFKHLALGRVYLESRVAEDNWAVNTALIELLLGEGNWLELRRMVATQTNFDVMALALRLENKEELGFRVVSVDLYRRCRRWSDAIRVCRRDKLHRYAIAVAAESDNQTIVQEILEAFLREERSESFCAALFHCYHLIEPDVALELAWRYNAWRYAMPYLIQAVYHLNTRIATLEADLNSHITLKPKTNQFRMLTWPPTQS